MDDGYDRIEQQITINASLDRVWELVSTPGWWIPTEAEGPVVRTPGHQTVRDNEKWGRFVVEVVQIEPQTYAAFRWASQFPNEELAPGKTTLVEFRVEPGPQGVNVSVVESGFASLDAPEAQRKAGFEHNTEGWQIELTELKEKSEAAAPA
jgi:uncharacterized protein YndB with AHSA1/START domain